MKLSRSQYAHFKLNVEEIMDRYNWANIANGIELRPGSCNSSNDLPFASSRTNTVDMQVRDWDRRDNSLKEFLLLSLPSEWKGKFNNVEGGGCELWQAIIHEFENETHDSHTQVLAAMYNIMQGNNESLESFVERLFIIIRKLEGMGETVSSNTKVMCFFNGLNSLYKPEDVNILLEQQLSLEQAAQLIAEFAECKRHEHERNHPLVQQVVNLIDLKPESQPVKTTAKSSTLPAPVPPDKATKFPVGELIDVHSAEQSSTSSNGAKKDAFSTHPTSPSVASPVLSSPTSDTHLSALHRTAFEVTSLHRGLQNDTGENNCFLNVTIQALWHLGPFRAHLTSFIQRVQQQPGENTKSKEKRANGAATVGLLDALCNLFVQYQFSDQAALPPTELRESLVAVSDDFKLGAIADANEALDAILQRIHAEQSASCPHAHKCLSHQVFGGNIMEQTICTRCGASSEPTLRSDFILTFQAAELLLEAKALFAKFSHLETEENALAPMGNNGSHFVGKMLPFNPVGGLSRFLGCARRHAFRNNMHYAPVSSTVNSAMHETEAPHHYGNTEFGHILSKCMTLHQRSCPSREFENNASPTMQKRSLLLNLPEGQGKKQPFTQDLCNGRASVLQYSLDPPLAVALSIGWTSSAESPATLQDFFDIIAYTIKLSDLFQVQGSSTPAGTATATAAPAPASTASYGSTSSAATAKGTSSMQHTSNTSRTHVHGGVGKGARAQSPTWEEWISPEVSENNPSYVFRGLVCYYGKHYVSIFQGMDGGHDNFLLFDDHTIKPIGDWNAVKDKCVKSHYQPVLLLYELEQAKI